MEDLALETVRRRERPRGAAASAESTTQKDGEIDVLARLRGAVTRVDTVD